MDNTGGWTQASIGWRPISEILKTRRKWGVDRKEGGQKGALGASNAQFA